MQDFLKSRLQNSPGGCIVNMSGVETHVTSGSRSVNSTNDSRKNFISPHYICIFAGLRKRIGVIRAAWLVTCF